MSLRTAFAALVGIIALQLMSVCPAAADVVMYDGTGFLQGQQSFSESFAVYGPGTLTVTLTNVDWPQSLASLNLVMSTPGGLLGAEMGPGTETFKVAGAGQIYSQWFGTAQGPMDVGVYSLKVEFAPVPLPASIGLLLSGLAVLVWRRHLRAPRPRGLSAGY